jgi:hypothetical protein
MNTVQGPFWVLVFTPYKRDLCTKISARSKKWRIYNQKITLYSASNLKFGNKYCTLKDFWKCIELLYITLKIQFCIIGFKTMF